MNKLINLAVLFGGRSGEHEVSLMSARSVLSVIDSKKYNVVQIGIDHEGHWWSGNDVISSFEKKDLNNLYPVHILPEPGQTILYKRDKNFPKGAIISEICMLDVIFPVLHGTFGEDGTLQGLMEMADCAYVGAGVLGSAVGMDKGIFKDVMKAHKIPVAEWIVVTRNEVEKGIAAIAEKAEMLSRYPLFIKPANLGSSVGITKAKNRTDLIAGIKEASLYDRRILIERGINAREIEVSVLGNEKVFASTPGEVIPSDEFYSYKAKYIDGKSGLLIPAPISAELTDQVKMLALQAYQAIDCAGMARVDFLLEKDTNRFFINEINTIPGFTSISMYPKLWDMSGISYEKLVNNLIELAIERKKERDKTKRTYGD